MNLVFDLDDTIYNLMEPFQATHETLYKDKTAVDATTLFMKSRVVCDEVVKKERAGLIAPEDVFYMRIKLAYEDYGIEIDREAAAEFERIYRINQKMIKPDEEVRELLDFCREKQICKAVLTNGVEKDQKNKAAFLKLNRWFPEENIFVSGAIGHQKPEPGAFHYVQTKLKLNPQETWYIGDSYDFDVRGAHGAGWRSIWYNHRQRPCPDEKNLADITVENSRDLKEIIKKMWRESL